MKANFIEFFVPACFAFSQPNHHQLKQNGTSHHIKKVLFNLREAREKKPSERAESLFTITRNQKITKKTNSIFVTITTIFIVQLNNKNVSMRFSSHFLHFRCNLIYSESTKHNIQYEWSAQPRRKKIIIIKSVHMHLNDLQSRKIRTKPQQIGFNLNNSMKFIKHQIAACLFCRSLFSSPFRHSLSLHNFGNCLRTKERRRKKNRRENEYKSCEMTLNEILQHFKFL